MDREQAKARKKAIAALHEAIGEMEPLVAQHSVIERTAAFVTRAYGGRSRGAGQSTVRMMIALRILEDDR